MKLHNISLEQAIGRISLICGGLLFFSLLFPIVPASTTAVDCQPGDPAPCTTKSAESYVDVEIIPAISLALQNRLDIEVIPKADGATQVGSATLQVATNHPDGYTIFMAAGKLDDEGKASLVNDAANAKINPIPTSSAALPMNTWGYKLTQTNTEAPSPLYQAVPADTTMIKQVDTTSYADKFSLDFGVAVNTSLPAGFYGNSVILSVVANPRIVRTLADLHYMQDMTTTLCEQTPGVEQDEKYKLDPVTKQLVDTRDGKKYWVAKLADGNCWMTQNLALDLSTDKGLTPADSDVATGWVPTVNTETTLPALESNPPYNTARSWNVGEYVLATPQRHIMCVSSKKVADWDSVMPGQTLGTECPDYQEVDASWTYMDATTGTWETTENASVGGTPMTYRGLVAANKAEKKYDSHYLVGNYYQYAAATAGALNASHSICPKGWRLPSAGSESNGLSYDYDGSFATLFGNYGYPKPGNSAGWSGLGYFANGYYAIDYAGATRMDSAPLHFFHNGHVYLLSGSLYAVGYDGVYWAGTPYTEAYAYDLGMRDGSLSPSAYYLRYDGYAVRCLAR